MAVFAVVQTGGKQFRVSEGQRFVTEATHTDVEAGKSFKVDQVLSIEGAKGLQVGAPFVAGASVEFVKVKDMRADKVLIFKKKRRNDYRRLNGHRQHHMLVEVKKIKAPGASA